MMISPYNVSSLVDIAYDSAVLSVENETNNKVYCKPFFYQMKMMGSSSFILKSLINEI